jgi:PEP-CTERM motif
MAYTGPMRRAVTAYASVIFLTVAASALRADMIPLALYNTGISSTGTLLADGATDPHYQLIQSAEAPFSSSDPLNTYVVDQNGWPIGGGVWTPDTTTSKWLAPKPTESMASGSDGVGTYEYETTFSLTGLYPSTARITGNWTSDNGGVEILLNGNAVSGATQFDYHTLGNPFTITSGFKTGLNTLVFVVRNDTGGTTGNPTGVRIELSGTASNTPEPESLGLVGLGLLGLGILGRRMARRR